MTRPSNVHRHRWRMRVATGLAVLIGLPMIGVAHPASADAAAASAVLSATPQWNGMAGNPGDASGQISAAATERGGRPCWTTTQTPITNDFLYFRVDAARQPATTGYAFVKVSYFDAGPGHFTIQYDGTGQNRAGDAVPLTGGNVWRSYVFQLADAEFKGDLPSGADFRIASWDSRLGRSATDLCVADVSVSFSTAEAVRITATNLVFSGSEPRTIPVTSSAASVRWAAADEQGVPAASGTAAVSGGTAAVDLAAVKPGYYTLGVTAEVGGLPVTRYTPVALLDALPADARRPGAPWGVGTHFSQSDPPSLVPTMAKVGYTHVRDALSWQHVEKTAGTYTMPTYGAPFLNGLAANGMEPLLVAAFANPLYDGGKTPSTPEGHAAFAAYASAMLTLSGTNKVEVYNEFDGGFNNGLCGRTPQCYLPLLQATYAKVKADHPQAEVVAPAGGGPAWWEELFQIGGLQYMDRFSAHLYGFPAPPEVRGLTLIPTFRDLIRRYNNGRDMPIDITENGFPTHTNGGVTELQQGDYLVRAASLAVANGASRYYWYDFLNDGTTASNQEYNFGVLRRPGYLGMNAYAPKPALVTQSVLIRQLAGLDFRAADNLGSGVYSYEFAGGPGKVPVRVMWATTPTQVELSTTTPVTVTNAYGRSNTLEPLQGKVTLDLTEHPVFTKGKPTALAVSNPKVYSVSVPDTVAVGDDIPVTLKVDRTHGGGGTWTNFHVEDNTYAVYAPAGQVGTKTVTVPGSTVKGPRTVHVRAGSGGSASMVLRDDAMITDPVVATVDPIVTSVGPLGGSLRVKITNNKSATALDVSQIAWTVGTQSGTVTGVAPVPPNSVTSVDIPVAGIVPWKSSDMSVRVDTAQLGAFRAGGTVGFNPIEADGQNAVVPVNLTADGAVDYRRVPYGGASDLSGTVKLTRTAEALWLTADVTDNVHAQTKTAGSMWDGDSIQLAISPDLPGRSTARVEIGAALLGTGPAVYTFTPPAGGVAGATPGATAAIVRTGTTTSYRVSVPWSALGLTGPPTAPVALSFVVNDDDDGIGRAGWIQWGGGIVLAKNTAEMRPVQVMAP
ncbi:sugar-binding protein [Micromonospora sp. NPDC049101]|uniref:sugar-binding protein n=1 Tax=Micromonospora sp. NPDC049101 TaxID=3155032 RepID=UPI0033F053D2